MKRYISAILVPCLLLQLLGCYSFKEISLNELSEKDDELIITTSDSSEYYLKKYFSTEEIIQNAGSHYSNRWKIMPESITILNSITYNPNKQGINPYLKNDTTKINNGVISKVMAQRINLGNTILLSLAIFGIIVLLAEQMPEKKWDFPQVKTPPLY
jgi:hypothetical protein